MITRRPGSIFAALAVATLSLLAVRVASHSETRPASSWIVPERWALDCTHEAASRRPTPESAAAVRELRGPRKPPGSGRQASAV